MPTKKPPLIRAKKVVNFLLSQPWAITDEKAEELIQLATNPTTQLFPCAKTLYSSFALGNFLDEDDLEEMPPAGIAYIKDHVALINLDGTITPKAHLFMRFSGGTSAETLRNTYLSLAANDSIKTVVTLVDSPGGNIMGVQEAANALAELSKIKNTIAVVDNGLMASAAYNIAIHSRKVVATPTSLVGSIGSLTAYRKTEGSNLVVIRSGTLKAVGTGEVTSEQHNYLVELVNKSAADFFKVVAERRNLNVDTIESFQGRVFSGAEALTLGLVDSLGYASDIVQEAYEKDKPKMSKGDPRQTLDQCAAENEKDSTIKVVESESNVDNPTTKTKGDATVPDAKETVVTSITLDSSLMEKAIERQQNFATIANHILNSWHGVRDVELKAFVEKAVKNTSISEEAFSLLCVKEAAANPVVGYSQKDRLSVDTLTPGTAEIQKISDVYSDALTLKAFEGKTSYKTFDRETLQKSDTPVELVCSDTQQKAHARKMSYLSPSEMVRQFYALQGDKEVAYYSKADLWEKALTPQVYSSGGVFHTPGSLPNLWEQIFSKRVLAEYVGTPSTYQRWATRGSNFNDFRERAIIRVSEVGLLRQVTDEESSDYDFFTDTSMKYRVARFSRIWGYTLEAFINDDMTFFTKLPSRVGRAPSRTYNRLAYLLLSSNPSFDSGNGAGKAFNSAAFSTSGGHSNDLGTGSFDAAMLNSMFKSLQKQQGLNTVEPEYLGLNLDFVLIGASDWEAAATLQQSIGKDSTNNSNNVWKGRYDIVLEPLIEAYNLANSVTIRYGVSQELPIAEYAFLDGYENPRMSSMVDFDTGNFKMKMDHSFGITWIDHRGIVRHGITAEATP